MLSGSPGALHVLSSTLRRTALTPPCECPNVRYLKERTCSVVITITDVWLSKTVDNIVTINTKLAPGQCLVDPWPAPHLVFRWAVVPPAQHCAFPVLSYTPTILITL